MSSYFDTCFIQFAHVLQANGDISQNGDDAIELFFNGTQLVNGNTLASYNITKEVSLTTANNISQLATKQAKQLAKLNLAASKRDDTYDINKLPTKYNGNAVVDNPNTGGLVAGRPWAT